MSATPRTDAAKVAAEALRHENGSEAVRWMFNDMILFARQLETELRDANDGAAKLATYARHPYHCGSDEGYPCNCGLDEALAAHEARRE